MTQFRRRLDAEMTDVRTDLARLTRDARQRGTRIRRRRRVKGALVTLAAVAGCASAALVVSAHSTIGPDDNALVADSASGNATPAPTTALVTVPLDGEIAASLLSDMLSDQGLKAVSSRGQGGPDAGGDVYAEVSVTGSTTVSINVQGFHSGLPSAEPTSYRQDDGKPGIDRWVAVDVDPIRGTKVTVSLVVPEDHKLPLKRTDLVGIATRDEWTLAVAPGTYQAPAPYTPLD